MPITGWAGTIFHPEIKGPNGKPPILLITACRCIADLQNMGSNRMNDEFLLTG